LLKNAVVSAGGQLPMYQDTGTAVNFAKKGQRVWTDVRVEEWLARGIFETYQRENLRYAQLVPLSSSSPSSR
jgi:fumarate hydratase, class I